MNTAVNTAPTLIQSGDWMSRYTIMVDGVEYAYNKKTKCGSISGIAVVGSGNSRGGLKWNSKSWQRVEAAIRAREE